MDTEKNTQTARELGRLPVSNSGKLYKISREHIHSCAKSLIAAYKKQYALSIRNESLSLGGEILLNEFYLVEKQIKLVCDAFEKIDMRGAPRFMSGERTGLPCVFVLAREFIRLNGGVLNVNSLTEFFEAYQSERSFSVSEIGMLKEMLRYSLLEYMHECIIKTSDDALLAQQLRNILSGFKKLDALDTDAAVTSLNVTDRILKQDEIYRVTDETSRSLYLNAAAKLAREFHIDETLVAHTALRLAKQAGEKAEEKRKEKAGYKTEGKTGSGSGKENGKTKDRCLNHVGLYLTGKGVCALRIALRPEKKQKSGSQKKQRRKTNTAADTNTNTNVKLSLFITAQLILAGVLLISAARENFLSLLLAIFPTLYIANKTIVSVCIHIVKPKPLPRFSSDFGIKSENRTLVCIPVLAADAKTLSAAAETLEMHYLANRVDNAEFALLADFRDAKTKQTDDDKHLTELGKKLIIALNEKYPVRVGSRFHYLQRERVYIACDKIFMGRERKRGALKNLIEYLLHGERGEFDCISPEFTEKFKYLAVLDADTVMPDGALLKLVCTAAHPMNQPVYDGNGFHVSGCSVIVPRIASTSRSAAESRFCALISGDAGMSCYRVCAGEFYQNVFGEGNFGGKGIIDIEAFEAALKDKIPDNTVLSHDMLEGCFAGVGFAGDITLYDGEPPNLRSWYKRTHRWLRGDFQLLPFLFGKLGKSLSALSKYKIFENIIRCAEQPSIFVSLMFSLLSARPVLFIYAFAAAFADPIIGFIQLIINSFEEKVSAKPLILLIRRKLFEFAVLPFAAFNAADAIIRALYRMIFSHKKMLEWQTAAAVKSKDGMRFSGYCGLLSPCLASGTLLSAGAAALVFTRINPFSALNVFSYLISAFWLLSPLIAGHLDGRESRARLNNSESAEIKRLSEYTWLYFKENCNEKTAFLPPDNFQLAPYKGAAMLTSPTNIGMGLAAVVSARDMGFINTSDMVSLLSKMLSSIEKAEKWNGHLFNWYALPTLSLLKPRFISTVDSGNLFVCLIIAVKALKEANSEDADNLSLLAEKLALDMDFTRLYDKNRMLFRVGYEFEQGRFTESVYDLYASEARLTSFAAIAFSKISSEHWFALSRLMCETSGGPALKSWGGTMFEYLMPLLFLETVQGSMQHEICRNAILTQILSADYKTPWGVSESGCYAFDRELRYQYRAFGNRQLALAPAHEKEDVIAPYASFLALSLEPKFAAENLGLLVKKGALGKYGMYEALDYTASGIESCEFKCVRSFMAHHQGMSLCAANNCLNDNILVKRFMELPAVRAHEQLLFENMPVNPIELRAYESSIFRRRRGGSKRYSYTREISAFDSNLLFNGQKAEPAFSENGFTGDLPPSGSPPHLENRINLEGQSLSNGNYTVFVYSDGSGFSKRGNLLLTRSGGIEGTREGIDFIVKSDEGCRTVAGNCIAQPHKITFTDRLGALKLCLEILISADFDCEIRKLTVVNCGRSKIQTETGIFASVALAERTEYEAHPAFLRLNTDAEQTDDSIIFSVRRTPQRKARLGFFNVLSQEEPYFCTDGLIMPGRLNSRISSMNIPVRGQNVSLPAEPFFSARIKTVLLPGESKEIILTAGIADSREEALNIIKQQRLRLENAEDSAEAQAQSLLSAFSIDPAAAVFSERLASFMFSKNLYRSGNVSDIALHGRENLWKFGISGDGRFALLRINSLSERKNLQSYAAGCRFLNAKGINFDFLIIGEYPYEYANPVRKMIEEIIKNTEGIRLIHGYSITAAEKAFLNAAAFAVLNPRTHFSTVKSVKCAENPEFRENRLNFRKIFTSFGMENERGIVYDRPFLTKTFPPHPKSFKEKAVFRIEPGGSGKIIPKKKDTCDKVKFLPPEHKKLLDFNGYGGFDATKGEYVIYISENAVTPLPWSNIIANETFGTLVTESGGGYTWRKNSRLFRLTPWTNDVVFDGKQEKITVKTEDWAESVSLPCAGGGEYEVRHGLGYSVFLCRTEQVKFILTETVDTELPVKYYNIRILNNTLHDKKLTVSIDVNWVLGDFPFASSLVADRQEWGVKAKNLLSEYDETGFLALKRGAKPIKTMDNGIIAEVYLKGAGDAETDFLLGCDKDENIERDIREADFASHIKKLIKLNEKRFAGLKIYTSDSRFDALVNGRLLYQVYSSRLFGKTSFYQSGGATGFRDQLQDVSALLLTEPERTKKQLLYCASKQFLKGDVLHWWHENGTGVRTHISDDRLFLPFVTCEYAETTGDFAIFNEICPYLRDIPISEGKKDLYTEFPEDGEGTLYEHCKKAIEISYDLGVHGLPLMGGGDWNDGMDCMDAGSESVMLGFFLIITTEKFIKVCELFNDSAASGFFRKAVSELRNNIEKYAWEHDRYIRAFYGDGAKLGSAECSECKIDCASECFAVFAGAKHAEEAFDTLLKTLVDNENGLIKLLSPPFSGNSRRDTGYIEGYLEGVRENGGQYTHAAVWCVIAACILKRRETADRLFRLINPAEHGTAEKIIRYKGEPYAVSGDVYSMGRLTGRAGWSWYTGAAGWLYRAATEYILGFKRRGNRLYIEPVTMTENFKIEYSCGKNADTVFLIEAYKTGKYKLVSDGENYKDGEGKAYIPLFDDGKEHRVYVEYE